MITSRFRVVAVTSLTAAFVMLTASNASAIDKCKVKVDKKTGVINVDASGVGGPLLWGGASGSETNVFFNAGTCVVGEKAKRCNLANPATLAAKTAPAGCMLFLSDGVTPCSAWISGCSPGARSAAGALMKDANGLLIGSVADTTGQVTVLRQEGGAVVRLGIDTYGGGFTQSGGLFYLTTDCTGPVVAGPDPSMIKPATAYGATAYYAPTVTSSQTFKSNLQFYGSYYTNQIDCDGSFGAGNSVFVPPDACCWTFVGTAPLGNAQTIDLSVFTTPFKVEVQ